MKKGIKFSFIGGDLRQIVAANLLCKEGHHVSVFGIKSNDDFNFLPKVKLAKTLKESLAKADVIALPLPVTIDEKSIKTTDIAVDINLECVFKNIEASQLVFAGKPSEYVLDISSRYGVEVVDYFKRAEFNILNSVPAVEGALAIAINETAFTLHSSKCLILGYGRLGKLLSRNLSALGSIVSVASKNCDDLAWIKINGYSEFYIHELSETIEQFDIIFNTIPSLILDHKLLSILKPRCLVIDLASRPGGVDFKAASSLGVNVIWALSLPGKTAPLTSGKILKDTFLNLINELEV